MLNVFFGKRDVAFCEVKEPELVVFESVIDRRNGADVFFDPFDGCDFAFFCLNEAFADIAEGGVCKESCPFEWEETDAPEDHPFAFFGKVMDLVGFTYIISYSGIYHSTISSPTFSGI